MRFGRQTWLIHLDGTVPMRRRVSFRGIDHSSSSEGERWTGIGFNRSRDDAVVPPNPGEEGRVGGGLV